MFINTKQNNKKKCWVKPDKLSSVHFALIYHITVHPTEAWLSCHSVPVWWDTPSETASLTSLIPRASYLPHMGQIELWPQLLSLILNQGCRNQPPFHAFLRPHNKTGRHWFSGRFPLRTTEVGCKSPWGQRSSVFIISVAIILPVIISCKISSLRQEMGVDASEEVKRYVSCIACCPAAVVWVSFPPQDLTQASACPSSKSSLSPTVKEAAGFHPRNHRWQDWVTISGSNAQTSLSSNHSCSDFW